MLAVRPYLGASRVLHFWRHLSSGPAARLLPWNTAFLLYVVSIILVDWQPLRAVLAIPVLLFIPGYALITALFANRRELYTLEEVALSVPISAALMAPIGIGLAISPWGLGLGGLLLSTGLLIGLLSALTYLRGRAPLPSEDSTPISPEDASGASREAPFSKLQLGVIGIAVVVFLSAAGYLAQPPSEVPGTDFYLLDAQGTAERYPTRLVAGSSETLKVGIVNREREGREYWVRAFLDGRNVGELGPIVVARGDEQLRTMQVVPGDESAGSGEWRQLLFQLHKDRTDSASVATTYLWVRVLPAQENAGHPGESREELGS